jgi:hypothetical protein
MTPSQRGRANRQKGVRFERAIATKLRKAGFIVRRNLEYDGFHTGADLLVAVCRNIYDGNLAFDEEPETELCWLPVAIQCKASQNKADLVKGLEQCQTSSFVSEWFGGNTLFVCLHSYRRVGKKPELRIIARRGACTYYSRTWDWLIQQLTVMKSVLTRVDN